jgi:hypothetical protein
MRKEMKKLFLFSAVLLTFCFTAPVIGQNEPIEPKSNENEITYRDIQDFKESYLAKRRVYRKPSKHKISKEHQIDPFSEKTYIRNKPARHNRGCFIDTLR